MVLEKLNCYNLSDTDIELLVDFAYSVNSEDLRVFMDSINMDSSRSVTLERILKDVSGDLKIQLLDLHDY